MADTDRSIVFVDDLRTLRISPPGIKYIRSTDAALLYLLDLWMMQEWGYADEIDELWLDHDMGGMNTTVPIAKFLEFTKVVTNNEPLRVKKICVHTDNETGARRLIHILERVGFNVERTPLAIDAVIWEPEAR